MVFTANMIIYVLFLITFAAIFAKIATLDLLWHVSVTPRVVAHRFIYTPSIPKQLHGIRSSRVPKQLHGPNRNAQF